MELPLLMAGTHLDTLRQLKRHGIDSCLFDLHRWRKRVRPNMRRIHRDDTANAGEPESPIRRTATCGGIATIEFRGAQPVRDIIGMNIERYLLAAHERVQGRAWNGRQSLVRRQPHAVLLVLEHYQDHISECASTCGERCEPAVAPHREACRRTDPDDAALVLVNR